MRLLKSIADGFFSLANMPLWKGLVLVLVAFLMLTAAFYLKTRFGNPGGENTRTIPDEQTVVVNPITDEHLQVFREDWDIYGRFEAWPALLPLAEMARTAYHLEPDAAREFAEFGFDTTSIISSPFHSQVAYIAKGEDVMVIVFRGTDETEDWFSNANVYLRGMEEGQIHSGFSGAYSTLRDSVLKHIADAKPKYLWITGHSLGGAMALICAHDLSHHQKLEINGVITFGQPMIGKTELINFIQDNLGDRYVHFVNEMDAVPFLPTGFSHCGLTLRFFRGKVHKSEDYFPVMAGDPGPFGDHDGGMNDTDTEFEYEAIESLPPPTPRQIREFNRNYDGEKTSEESIYNERNVAAARESREYAASVPWFDDHTMDAYVEKIESAIEKAKKQK